MNLSLLDYFLWAAGFFGHVALVLIVVLRKRLKNFPAFTFFLGFEAITTVALFFISKYGNKHTYFLTYWITGFTDYPLLLWVVFQLARDVFRPIRILVRESQKSLWVSGTLIVITAAALSIGLGAPVGAKGFDLWENRVSVFTSLVVCVVLVVVGAVANNFGVPQGKHSVALELGLFVWSYSILLHDVAHAVVGWNRDLVAIGYIREFVYLAVILYWMVVFWNREQERPPLPPELLAYMRALHVQVECDINELGGPPK